MTDPDPPRPPRFAINPVLYKDLLTFARAPGAGGGLRNFSLALLFGAPLLLLAWVVASFPGPWRFAGSPVFTGVAALMALFSFAVAVPAATAFALERDRETLEGLIVSPLRPWQLVLGKLGAALVLGLLTRLALLPVLAVAFTLGGADLGFIPRWMFLLLMCDASFASLALLIGSRRRDASARVGWFRAQTSQAQMALQSSVGLSVLATLIPLYASLFLIPLAIQQGVRLPETLDALAPLGALHPLAALVLWGDAELFGVTVPVWLLGSAFHLTLCLPLLADAAEGLKAEGAAPGRAPRLLTLPAAALGLALVWTLADRLPLAGRTGVALCLPALLLLLVALRTAFSPPRGTVQVTRRRVLEGLLLHRAVESLPERAPGFVLLLGLLSAPLLLSAGAWRSSAMVGTGALLLSTVALAAFGAALVARGRSAEDRAFLDALARPEEPEPPGEEEQAQDKAPRGRALLLLGGLAGVLPLLAAIGLALARGGLPELLPLAPLFRLVLLLGLALNPLTSLVPVAVDPTATGTDAPLRAFQALGIDPDALLLLHVTMQLTLLVGSFLSLRPPLDVERALGEHLAAERARQAPDPGPPASPA